MGRHRVSAGVDLAAEVGQRRTGAEAADSRHRARAARMSRPVVGERIRTHRRRRGGGFGDGDGSG